MALQDYTCKERPQWCPGCGNYAILGAIKGALDELRIPAHNAVVSSGIGCSSKIPHYVNVYGFEGIHGRGVPVASAIKLANHKLTVISMGGDGDGYGIGSAHFLHVMRRNYDMTYVVHNNQIYGLTTGQASPTSQLGMKTKTTPHGVIELPVNPTAVAITSGATFVARVFAGDMAYMKKIMAEAIAHKGFSLVDVLQPCVTFNKLNTYDFFTKRVYKLDEAGHDPSDRKKAMEKAMEDFSTGYEKMPIGVFYKEKRPTYEDQLPQLREKALAEQDIENVDVSHAMKKLM